MEKIIYLFTIGNRTFVAKCIENKYVDVVEFTQFMSQQGMQLMGILIGIVDTLPDNIAIFIVDTNSSYYSAYFQTTSNIQPVTTKKIFHK